MEHTYITFRLRNNSVTQLYAILESTFVPESSLNIFVIQKKKKLSGRFQCDLCQEIKESDKNWKNVH